MSGWRDFGTSKIPGVTRYWADDGEGGGVVRTVQDVTAIVERNKAMANENDGYNKSRDFKRAGTVPYLTLYKWIAEAHLEPNDPDFTDKLNKLIIAKLNDSDYRHLRTIPGRAG
jgi:hypothetical protein